MLRIVIENLLDNACKYSGKCEAPLIEFGHDDEGYFVRDNGAGFDERYAHKLFQPFERLHGDDSFAGTGIGLANVKRIIEKHGGRVSASSRLGEGATFRFTLPTQLDEVRMGAG
jgi:signal transduction histidine kinase